ncbi:hypothetical protein JTB14_030644 [Gonioctena quinquepunctata]|nr:hypothetical protein JTB14_030644 [Gonioctena quinquepunctata]
MKVICLVLVSFAGVAFCRNLPSFVEVCHRSDPKIKDCLVKNVEKLRPKFLKGVPELLIPSFDPLLITKATLETGDSFSAEFENIQIYHADEFKLQKLDFNLEPFKLDMTILFPKLRILSTYTVKGKILVLQLNGSGPADGNYTNVVGMYSGEGTHFTKNGKDHIKLQHNNVSLDIGKAHLYFDRIFGDNVELNLQTNKIINENIESLISELSPVVSKIVGEFISGITSRLFDKYSFDELFPNP